MRARAKTLHDTADRADSSRYAERGGQLDDATRAAQAARQTAELARQQAQRERDTATANRKEAVDYMDDAGEGPGDDMIDIARSRVHQASAATARAERAERAAAEAAARAEELEQQLPELQTAAEDSSVPMAIGGVAHRLDSAADQLDEKARLLDEVARVEAEAVQFEAEGDPTSAQQWRESAAYTRAKADATNPVLPDVDPRILAAAGVSTSTTPAEIEMDPVYVGRDAFEQQVAPVPEDPMPMEDPAPAPYESGSPRSGTTKRVPTSRPIRTPPTPTTVGPGNRGSSGELTSRSARSLMGAHMTSEDGGVC